MPQHSHELMEPPFDNRHKYTLKQSSESVGLFIYCNRSQLYQNINIELSGLRIWYGVQDTWF